MFGYTKCEYWSFITMPSKGLCKNGEKNDYIGASDYEILPENCSGYFHMASNP